MASQALAGKVLVVGPERVSHNQARQARPSPSGLGWTSNATRRPPLLATLTVRSMRVINEFYTKVAIKLYPARWLLVVAFFLPFIGWSPVSTALLAMLWMWTTLGLFIVLTYGPIKHFEGSIIWSDGWRPMAWFFLIPFIMGTLSLTVLIPYALLQNS